MQVNLTAIKWYQYYIFSWSIKAWAPIFVLQKAVTDLKNGLYSHLNTEIQNEGPNNSAVPQNRFFQEITSPLFNLGKFSKTEKTTAESGRMHLNLINDEKFGSFKCLIWKYRRGDQIIQPFCRIGSFQEIRSSLFSSRKLSKTDKSTAESCILHLNLINDEEFGSFKCLTLKYRRGDQRIQPFCRIGSPQKIISPLFNLSKFWKFDKSTADSCRMHWNIINDKNLGPSNV